MPIPDYQSLMLPVLAAFAQGEARIGAVVEALSVKLGLTPEDRAELLPSGKQTLFNNRVHWAKTYLDKAGLIESTRRAHFKITPRGLKVLESRPTRIDNRLLSQFPEFQRFFNERSTRDASDEQQPITVPFENQRETPDEAMRAAHRQIEEALAQELLDRIQKAPPDFFERLMVNLLLKMGFGGSVADAGRALGRSGDGGVDGVIDQDAVGLDRIVTRPQRVFL